MYDVGIFLINRGVNFLKEILEGSRLPLRNIFFKVP